MDRTPVQSSNIRSVGYDPASRTLEVEFHSSGLYQYSSVPEAPRRQTDPGASKEFVREEHYHAGSAIGQEHKPTATFFQPQRTGATRFVRPDVLYRDLAPAVGLTTGCALAGNTEG